MIQYTHTIFYVKDIGQTLKFYEAAFGLKPKFVHESHAYAELDTGAVALAFAAEELGAMNFPDGFIPNRPSDLPQGCEIAFRAADPHKFYRQALAAGAQSLSPPTPKPWGQEVGYVRDPSGILIEIAGKM